MLRWLQIVFTCLTAAGIAYQLLCLWSAFRFLGARRKWKLQVAASLPPVSILKPVHGTDREAYESFRSHCLLDYPEYEIIFGVNDEADTAIPLIGQLIREFPQRRIKLIVCSRKLGTNRKVSSLIQMLPEARYQHLLVNDGDIRVPPDYLQRIIARFSSSEVGLVTCLYHGNAGKTLGSKLEALGISTDFTAGVLVARQIEGGIRFGLGSTLAFHRDVLKQIGGFESVVDYLADDYELGSRIAAAGYKVALADTNVETFLPPYSLADFYRHQLRWARGVRDSRPWGYAGFIVSFAVPWAVAAVMASHAARGSIELLAAALLVRMAVAFVIASSVLQDAQSWRDIWLLPLRDVIALLVWAASFAGHKVSWRGTSFILEKGKLRSAQ